MKNVSLKAVIGKNVSIAEGVIIYDNVIIGDNTFIGPNCIIGEPTMGFYRDLKNHNPQKTIIGSNSIIRSFTTIYEDVHIGEYFQTGHHAIIREETRIGHHTSFGSFSEMPGKSTIGNYVRIHSKVMMSERNIIDDYVWIFPFVVITNVKHPPIGKFQVTHIKEYAQIFASAVILPGITIGRNAIIGAGAMVAKNVPDERMIVGNPGKDIKSIREIYDEEGSRVYPWRDYLEENRGYPWQNKSDD